MQLQAFLLSATKDNFIYSLKNHWFGYKSQTHGLEWAWFLVVIFLNFVKTLNKDYMFKVDLSKFMEIQAKLTIYFIVLK
jgi:hypothetical protein